MSKTYLITGGNRGIGLRLIKELLKTPTNRVIATVRDVSASADLTAMADATEKLSIITLDLGSGQSLSQLRAQLSIAAPEGIDAFISNAGIGNSFKPVMDTPREDLISHFVINAVAPIEVFKAVHPFLEMRETKKAFFITSMAASNSIHFASTAAYADSKAALNKLVGLLASEMAGRGYTISLIHPGVVETDMFKVLGDNEDVPKEVGDQMRAVLITPEQSASMMLKVIDEAGPEKSGKFLSYDGGEVPW